MHHKLAFFGGPPFPSSKKARKYPCSFCVPGKELLLTPVRANGKKNQPEVLWCQGHVFLCQNQIDRFTFFPQSHLEPYCKSLFYFYLERGRFLVQWPALSPRVFPSGYFNFPLKPKDESLIGNSELTRCVTPPTSQDSWDWLPAKLTLAIKSRNLWVMVEMAEEMYYSLLHYCHWISWKIHSCSSCLKPNLALRTYRISTASIMWSEWR